MQGRPPSCWVAKLHQLKMAGVDINRFRPSSAKMLAGIPDSLTEALMNDPIAQIAHKEWLEDIQWDNMQKVNKRAGQNQAADSRKNPSRDIVKAYKDSHGWDDKFKNFKANKDTEIPEPSALQIANWWIAQGNCNKSDKPNLLKRLRRLDNIK